MQPRKLAKPKKVSEMGPKELELYHAKIRRHREEVAEAAMERLSIREFVDPIASKEMERIKRRNNLPVQKHNQRYEVMEKSKGKGSNFKLMNSSSSADSM